MPDREVSAAVKGGPSEAAVEAMAFADSPDPAGHGPLDVYERLLTAAHDPALGLDRSVRLGDVVEWMKTNTTGRGEPAVDAFVWADAIAREFGATTSEPILRCKVCEAALNVGQRHKHEAPGWKPRYDDLEGALEGYETESIHAG